MGTRLSTLFFTERHLLGIAIVVILLWGGMAAWNLPRIEDPRITLRDPLVITPVPGASADRVESLVTKVLEDALNEIPEIFDLESTSRAGISVISIELHPEVGPGTNQQLFTEIRDQVSAAAAFLPPDAGTPIVDDKRDPIAFTLIAGVTWDGEGDPQLGLLGRLGEELADRWRNVPGTEIVRIYGAVEEEIVVETETETLAQLGLSTRQLAGKIAGADAKRSSGTLRGASSDLLLEVDGELETLERLRRVPIGTDASSPMLPLGDLATVERSWQTPESEIGLIDGRRTVFVAARSRGDIRVDEWAPRALATLEAFEAERGAGISIERIFEQEPYTTENLSTLVENLLAGVLVILAVVLFVMGLRQALVIATALPLVVASVLVGWQFTDGAVHQISIFGMIIALGLLIDNAIVITDEVTAEKAKGASAVEAVGRSVRHLFWPLLASTLTTMLAFAPIMLLPGSAGDFVGSIGTSVVLAVGASFLLAMTVTAALAGIFSRPAPIDPGSVEEGTRARVWWRHGWGSPRLTRRFSELLTGLLRRPALAIAVALFLPACGFAVAGTLGNQFFPPIDRNVFELRVWMPSDASLATTEEEARSIDATLRTFDAVEQVSWLIGGSHPSVYYNLVMNQDGASEYAQAIVKTRSSKDTEAILDRVQETIDEKHPRAQVVVRQLAQGPPIFADIEWRLYGPRVAELQDVGDRLRVALQSHPDVLHTQMSLSRGEPKLIFRADEDSARLAGLALTDVADQFESNLEGVVAGSVLEDLESIPVRVRIEDENRRSLASIASLPLVTRPGQPWLSAASLGEFELVPELGGITRFDRERTNTVKAYVRNGALPIDVGRAVFATLEEEGFTLPAGVRLDVGGAEEQDRLANQNLAQFAPILATLMVAILILVFRSVRYAMVLGVVAIASGGLALLSTWAINFPISFNTILGTLGLIGVALNDSIVVLAAIRAHPTARDGDVAGVVEAILGCTRHVVSTTLTKIGGFLPLLLFVGGDFWPSLAIVLAGGIAGATLIALLFIPGAHCWIHRRARRTSPDALIGGAA